MKILVTGNLGYIGPILTKALLHQSDQVVGVDTDFYQNCEICPFSQKVAQIYKDIRRVDRDDLKNVDAVIHLAAFSNDPLGDFNPKITEEINYQATIRLAKLAKDNGISRFIFASTQSIYGISKTDRELDEEAPKNPVTVYAKTKWQAEQEIKKMAYDKFVVVCLRPSTVFGVSPRLRCDIVFNNLVASAFCTGKINLKSDGTPWRPVVHIEDVSQAFIACLEAPKNLVNQESFNVGIENGNYTVKDLALAAQKAVKGSQVTWTKNQEKDPRTYRVSFKKILTVLGNYYKPKWNLDLGGKELVDFFRKVKFNEKQFSGRRCNRLKQIKYLIQNKKIDRRLFWIDSHD